jgi:hypothetical protein
MRLLGLVLTLILIQLGIGLFYNNLNTSSDTFTPYSAGENNVTIIPGLIVIDGSSYSNRLWEFILAPSIWTNSGFWAIIVSLIIIGGGIAIGTLFGAKSDLTYLFPLFLFLAAFGAIPIANLFTVIYSEVGVFAGCNIGEPCLPASLTALFFSGALAAAYIFSCVEFWSGRPMT